MTKDELEAVKENWLARFNRLKAKKDWAGALAMLRASPEAEARALLYELKVARNFAVSQAEILHHTAELREIAEHRATRAEAHAERLASALTECVEDLDWLSENEPDAMGWVGHDEAGGPWPVSKERAATARQALSAYNQRTET